PPSAVKRSATAAVTAASTARITTKRLTPARKIARRAFISGGPRPRLPHLVVRQGPALERIVAGGRVGVPEGVERRGVHVAVALPETRGARMEPAGARRGGRIWDGAPPPHPPPPPPPPPGLDPDRSEETTPLPR